MAEIPTSSPAVPGDHEHPEFLAHHFQTPAQQADAAKFGMWIFLVTEILFFSGLFCAYAVYRANHPAMFSAGAKLLHRPLGAINTGVLIASSFTMALGVYCAQKSNRRGLIACLSLTLLGGCVFMGIKSYEYADKIRHGEVWGAGFSYHPPAAHQAGTDEASHRPKADAPARDMHRPEAAAPAHIERSQVEATAVGPQGPVVADGAQEAAPAPDYRRKDMQIFMGIYFCLTGLHGIHVLAGMGVIAWLLVGAVKGRYSGAYYTPVDLGGLYWHLVDLIWIYLFPLLYLID